MTGNRIYAYTVIGKDSEPWERTQGQKLIVGAGMIKVGQTTKSTARERIKEQLGTAYPDLVGVSILLDEPAIRTNGTEFADYEVHKALVAAGIRRPNGEWFEASIDEVRSVINHVRSGQPLELHRTQSFQMRPEQRQAVNETAAYFQAHSRAAGGRAPKFLWNAKMRFGKTFTTYQLAKAMGWKRVLVLTFKPAVATAWRDDLMSHVNFVGWRYIDRSSTTAERDDAGDSPDRSVWFSSFQDLGGRDVDGNVKAHNENIHLTDWDCIVIDEYHFGAWRQSARDLYDPNDAAVAADEEPDDRITEDDIGTFGLKSDHYLYLSGTPFRAITDGEFNEDEVFNWTYIDEQRAKETWDNSVGVNPYVELPRMEMYSYEMGKDAAAYAEDGEFNGFSLNEFFRASRVDSASKSTGPGAYVFAKVDQVSEFLEMLRGKLSDQMKVLVEAGQKAPFPYESPLFKQAVRHSVWYMDDVASCFAMRDLLLKDPYFGHFEVVVAAGAKAGQGAAAQPPVDAAIARASGHDLSGSITLSCGKLMTGVTIREWGAILMLRSLKSPESYFQSAFRVQSPWAYRDAEGGIDIRKPTCFVFEFDPNRALALVAEYGSKLATTGGVTPAEAIGQLINYLPIFGFAGGAMTKLDASAVLDWATAGIGAAALARRWNSPLLVEVNEHTLAAVLAHPELMAALDQIEDFRVLVNTAGQVITNTKLLKKAKREQGGQLTKDQRKTENATGKQRKEIREKLQKFLAKIPVFMYATDFREEALKHVIESLDSDLFERVTGLTVEDFKLLSSLGLFNAQNMNSAIYQFRAFESASLDYALTEDERGRRHKTERNMLWDGGGDS